LLVMNNAIIHDHTSPAISQRFFVVVYASMVDVLELIILVRHIRTCIPCAIVYYRKI